MSGEHDPDHLTAPGTPPASSAPAPGGGKTPEADLSASEKNEAAWAARSKDDGKTAKVGARDVDLPVGPRDEGDPDDAGGDELHDRLARKDQTPVDEGGSSSLA